MEVRLSKRELLNVLEEALKDKFEDVSDLELGFGDLFNPISYQPMNYELKFKCSNLKEDK